jgi:hypothetical protein
MGATLKTAPAAPAKDELEDGEVVESEGGETDGSTGQESAGERDAGEVVERGVGDPADSRGQRMAAALSIIRSAAHGQVRP